MANRASFKRAARVKRTGRIRPQSRATRKSVVVALQADAVSAPPIRIDKDGQWHSRYGPITRQRVLKLYAKALRSYGYGKYALAAPCDKVRVEVEDAPFIGVQLGCEGEGPERKLRLRTNLDEEVTIGPDSPVRFERDAETGGLIPYVLLRDGLEARCSRSVAFELAALASEEVYGGVTHLGLWSAGVFFPICAAQVAQSA
jgi:hypothetical protein